MSTKKILIWTGSVLGAVILVVVLGIVLGRLGVGGDSPDVDSEQEWEDLDKAAATAERSKDRPLRVTVIAELRNNAFGKGLHLGALKAQQELDRAFVTFAGLVDGTKPGEQVHVFRSKLDDGSDAMVIDPAAPKALPPHIKEASNRRVPTVVADMPVEGGVQIGFVANDYEAAGALAASWLAAELGDKGKVALLRHQKEAAHSTAREKGFLDAVKTKHKGLEIVSDDQYAGLDEKGAGEIAKALLTKAKPDGVFCSGETGAVARVPIAEAGPDTIRVTGPAERIVEGIPPGGGHWTRTHRFGPDGGLYVHVGSSCNVCAEEDPGAPPCSASSPTAAVRRSTPQASETRSDSTGSPAPTTST